MRLLSDDDRSSIATSTPDDIVMMPTLSVGDSSSSITRAQSDGPNSSSVVQMQLDGDHSKMVTLSGGGRSGIAKRKPNGSRVMGISCVTISFDEFRSERLERSET